MGIDFLDLGYRVEQRFRICIPRADAERAFGSGTVGELYAYVLERLGGTRWPHCLGIPVFYRVRRALADCLGARAESVTPADELAPLLPTRGRRRAWRELGRALD